jgi:hypothetical protein
MATVLDVRRNDAKARDFHRYLVKLNNAYDGKWVAILKNGEVIAKESLTGVYAQASKRPSKILALFRASKKKQLMYK